MRFFRSVRPRSIKEGVLFKTRGVRLRIKMTKEKEDQCVTSSRSQQIVTPWEVVGEKGDDGEVAINYDKLINDFGVSRISVALVKRIEKLTGKPVHHLIRRGVFFAHRDLDHILDLYEKDKKFYIYTGRGPSSENLHIGHIIPFSLCK